MALRNLAIEEMVRISDPWINPNKAAHSILQGSAVLSGMLPLIVKVHTALVSAVPKSDGGRFALLTANMAQADAQHDRALRAVFDAMSVLAELDQSGKVAALLQQILPDGLAHNSRTFRAEAGHVALVEARLTAEDWALLESQPVGRVTLRELVESWLTCGKALGELEEERVQLETTEQTTGAWTNEARLGWIQVVNALRPLTELAGLTEEQERILLSPLRDAELKSDQRAARTRAAAQVTQNQGDSVPGQGESSQDQAVQNSGPAAAGQAGANSASGSAPTGSAASGGTATQSEPGTTVSL